MKLIIVLGVKEHENDIKKMFSDSKIPIFSKVDVEGIKSKEDQLDLTNWFGSEIDSDLSIMFFAFIANGNAEMLFDKVKEFNANENCVAFVHAFQMPVEKYV